MSYRRMKLADVCSSISYGYTESAADDIVGPKFLRITDIQGGVVDWASVPYCPIDEKNFEKYKLEHGDIVVARTGNSTGENYYFDSEIKSVFASYLIRFQINRKIANPYFVWLNMRTKEWQNFVASAKSGSAQAGANAKTLGSYELILPERKKQDYVSSFIRSINQKITLNRQINQTLEAMAQALFKSWFVDFEPVKAKMAALSSGGNDDDTNLAAMSAISGKSAHALLAMQTNHPEQYQQIYATAELFPSEMVESELGEIPNGWEVLPLSEIIEITGGGTPKRSEDGYWNGEINWFSVKDAPSGSDVFVVDTEKKITQLGVANSSTKILPIGTTIISARGTVGKLALVGTETAMNQSCYGVNGKQSVGAYLNYLNIKHMVIELQRNTHGAVFDTITTKTFETVHIVNASRIINQHFEKAVNPLFNQIKSNLFEVKSLTEIRNGLLNKLLSGNIKII